MFYIANGLAYRPCNRALLASEADRPATVFSIHNLAYQGDYPYDTFTTLKLPDSFWSPESLEFYDRMSFIKGGLVYAR